MRRTSGRFVQIFPVSKHDSLCLGIQYPSSLSYSSCPSSGDQVVYVYALPGTTNLRYTQNIEEKLYADTVPIDGGVLIKTPVVSALAEVSGEKNVGKSIVIVDSE